MIVINLIDDVLSVIAPRAAYNRAAWRMAYGEIRNYDAGTSDRLNDGWRVENQNAEQTDAIYRDTIRARGRDLERNSDLAESMILAYERNVIGQGFKLQAKTAREELNRQIESLWERWVKPRNCDVTGTQAFADMCRMIERRILVDGGVIILKRFTEGGVLPFKLQVLEVDDLDTGRMPDGGKKIIGGIEFNDWNKPVAYYIKRYDGFGFFYGESVRIDAKDVIFLWHKLRPSQVREMSGMKHTITRIRDINQYLEAVSLKERVAACLAVFIKRNAPQPGGSMGRNATAPVSGTQSYKGKNITPGMIMELFPGDDIAPVTPPAQGGGAAEFARLQQRIAGAGQGLSYESASRDMSQVNYSSARQGLLEDRKSYGIEQQYLVDHFFTEVYETFIISAVLSGALMIPDFWENKESYLAHTWTPPGQKWIDPLKEAKAYQVGLESCQTTIAEIAAENGQDWRDLLVQRAKEIEFMKSIGLLGGGGDDEVEKS